VGIEALPTPTITLLLLLLLTELEFQTPTKNSPILNKNRQTFPGQGRVYQRPIVRSAFYALFVWKAVVDVPCNLQRTVISDGSNVLLL